MNKERREINFTFLTEPTDINFGGNVHGGIVMKWIDQVAYSCAAGWSGRYCVTVYVGGIQFYKPIPIGHLVKVNAKIIYTGNTSMHIAVDVYSAPPFDPVFKKTTHCVIIFVAIDEQKKPIKIPKWIPISENDKQLEEYALKLMELRKNIQEEMKPFLIEE